MSNILYAFFSLNVHKSYEVGAVVPHFTDEETKPEIKCLVQGQTPGSKRQRQSQRAGTVPLGSVSAASRLMVHREYHLQTRG